VNGLGEFFFEIRADPSSGVIDMLAGPSEDALALFPSRVVALADGGSAFTFTMFRAPGQPDEQFEGQYASLQREFDNLRRRFGRPADELKSRQAAATASARAQSRHSFVRSNDFHPELRRGQAVSASHRQLVAKPVTNRAVSSANSTCLGAGILEVAVLRSHQHEGGCSDLRKPRLDLASRRAERHSLQCAKTVRL
jgi:hypothetical protein